MPSDLQIFYGDEAVLLDSWEDARGVAELNLLVRSAKDLTGFSGSHSKPIRLPATGHNLATFGFPLSPGGIKTYSRATERVVVKSGGALVLAGKGRVSLFTGVLGKEDTLELIVFGGNLQWVQDLAETSLRETTNLGEFRLSRANIEDSWNAAGAYDALSGVRCFPVSYGQWKVGTHLPASDLRPHINIRHLLETIFAQHGFTITGDWISSTNLSKTYRLFVDNGAYTQPPEFSEDYQFSATRTSAQSLTDASGGLLRKIIAFNFDTGTDPAGQLDTATGIWEAAVAQEVAFTVNAGLELPGAATATTIQLVIVHKDADTAVETDIATLTDTAFSGNNQFAVSSDYIETDEGDQVWAEFRLSGPIASGVNVISNSVSGIDTDFSSSVTLKIVEGSRIEPTNYLPEDKTQLWLVQQLGILNNLVFDTDPIRRTVLIEPWPDYYEGTSTALDKTTELDNGQRAETTFKDLELDRFQVYRYSEDRDDAKVEYLEGLVDNGLPLHAWKEDLGERYVYREATLSVDFAPTAIVRENAGFIQSGTAHLPQLWKELPPEGAPDPAWDFEERLVIYDGQDATVDWDAFEDGNTVTGWPFARPVDYFATSDQDDSLAWEDIELNSGAKLPGLFSRYYYEWLLQKTLGRTVTAEIYWTRAEVAKLSFRQLVRLKTPQGVAFYRLLELRNYAPGVRRTTTTVLELVVKVDPEPKERLGWSGTLPWETLVGGGPIPAPGHYFPSGPGLVPSIEVDPDDGVDTGIPGGSVTYEPRLAGGGRYGPPSVMVPGGDNYARPRRGAMAVGVGARAVATGSIAGGVFPVEDAEALLNLGAGTGASARESAFRLTRLGQQSGATSTGGSWTILGPSGLPLAPTRVLRYTVDYTDLTPYAGGSLALKVDELFDGDVMGWWKLKVTTALAGGSLTAATVRPIFNGQTGGEKFTAADIFTASGASGGYFEVSGALTKLPSQVAPTDLELELALTGEQFGNITAGNFTVWIGTINLL